MVGTSPPDERCIHRAFELQAKQHPAATAVSVAGESITYQQLDGRANFLAAHLQTCGVKSGQVVAVSMTRSLDMIVALLAILKCGAAYLPLDESSPPSRSSRCLDDACVVHVICDGLLDEACAAGRTIIGSAAPWLFRSSRPSFESAASTGEQLAYVMFTSGSTGSPKGVKVPHRAVLRLVLRTNFIQIALADKVLQCSPTSFDASTFEIWGALLNGATLVLYSERVFDPNALERDIALHGVTILWLTAALFHLVAHGRVRALAPIKVLLAGGDVLAPEAVNKVLDAVPGILVINGYGPTENTTFTCCHRMTAENRPSTDGVPIGRAISGTRIFVLDEQLCAVREGEAGELFVAGEGVALGYLGGDSEGRFFRDDRICSGLIYRTGDLVRQRRGGELEFIGRRDRQVKIRGFRVSLDEIRSNLLQVAGVVEAVVLPLKDAMDQLLVAYLQVEQGTPLTAAEVRRQLAPWLPRYMIPDRFVLTAQLPITPNGKVDLRLLTDSHFIDTRQEHVS